MEIEVVTDGLEFPEGPVAMDDGSVIVCEIRSGRLTRVLPDGRKLLAAETGGGPNGAAIGPDGAIWVTNNGSAFQYEIRDGVLLAGKSDPNHRGGMLQRVNLATGKVETVFDGYEGQRFIAPNDLVFDRQGGLWFTDHGGDAPGVRRLGALYYLEPGGGKLTRPRDSLMSPNGVGLSPDESVVYMCDSHMARVWAFDLASPGKVASTRGRGHGRVLVNLQGYQPLDSMAVEADGKVCAATIQNGGVTVVDLDGSSVHLPFPDVMTTNICFGGSDMRTAWATGSSTGRLFRTRWPRPGLRLNFNA